MKLIEWYLNWLPNFTNTKKLMGLRKNLGMDMMWLIVGWDGVV